MKSESDRLLGHWHGFGRVGKHPNVYYSGSTERTSSADLRMDKGFVTIGLGPSLQVDFHPIRLRPTYRVVVDAADEIAAQLDTWQKQHDTTDALIYVVLENLSAVQSIDLPNDMIEAHFPKALSVQIRRLFRFDDAKRHETVNAASLQDYFTAFLKEQCRDDGEFDRLNEKISALFARYDEDQHDT